MGAIALINGPRFYMSCFQINVGGSGTATPSPTVKFPGAYSATDPVNRSRIKRNVIALTYVSRVSSSTSTSS